MSQISDAAPEDLLPTKSIQGGGKGLDKSPFFQVPSLVTPCSYVTWYFLSQVPALLPLLSITSRVLFSRFDEEPFRKKETVQQIWNSSSTCQKLHSMFWHFHRTFWMNCVYKPTHIKIRVCYIFLEGNQQKVESSTRKMSLQLSMACILHLLSSVNQLPSCFSSWEMSSMTKSDHSGSICWHCRPKSRLWWPKEGVI